MHFDTYLGGFVEQVGAWAYPTIFAVIFAETGLVITPFLPGESLLLTSGTLAGTDALDIVVLAPLLFTAALLGDVSNYLIGRFVGHRLFERPRRFVKPEHLASAHEFYERHGGQAIVFARFLPVVRTLAPFVAGIAGMPLKHLLAYASVASAGWVTVFLGAGYWFGNIPWIRDHLTVALAGAVLLSVLPGVIVFLLRKLRTER